MEHSDLIKERTKELEQSLILLAGEHGTFVLDGMIRFLDIMKTNELTEDEISKMVDQEGKINFLRRLANEKTQMEQSKS